MAIHEFKVGDFRAVVIREGVSSGDMAQQIGARYPNATEAEVTEALIFAEAQAYSGGSSMNLLYLEANGEKILVDTGMGAKSPRPEFGHGMAGLQEAGISPEEISIVFITHCHGDHINGLLDTNDNPAFPNARYMMLQQEWNEWMNPERIAAMEEKDSRYLTLAPFADKFIFLKDKDSITEGVTAHLAAGHTQGHCGLLIESEGEKLLHLVDLLHHPVQFKYPHWHMVFDSDREQGVKSRKEELAKAADSGILTLFYHLPFPALGHVEKVGDSFEWKSI